MLFFIKDLLFIIYKKLSALSICLINQADAPQFFIFKFFILKNYYRGYLCLIPLRI